MVRLFYAVELPEPMAARIAPISKELGLPGVSLAKGPFHITLVFMGDAPPEKLGALKSMLCGIKLPRFTVCVRGLSSFGPVPKVLFAKITTGASELTEISLALSAKLDSCGVQFDRKPFHPHVTLARVKRPDAATISAVGAVLDSRRDADLGCFECSSVLLKESRLSLSAPYLTLAAAPLG